MYLPDPETSKFIDEEVLEWYMHVGGLRIEDDILMIERDYNKTTLIPKGKEMLDVIRQGAECHYGMDCQFRLDPVSYRNFMVAQKQYSHCLLSACH